MAKNMNISSESQNDLITTDSVPSEPRSDAEILKKESIIPEQQVNKPILLQSPDGQQPTFKTKTKSTKPLKTKKIFEECRSININNSSNVHVGNNVTINYGGKGKKSEKFMPNTIKSQEVKVLISSNVQINSEHMLFTAEYLGTGWKLVARNLLYTEGQIEKFLIDHSASGIKEVIYQFLLNWYRNDPDKATLGALADALWETKQYEVVNILSKKYGMEV